MRLDIPRTLPLRRPRIMRPIVTTAAQEAELYSVYADSIAIWSDLAAQIAARWTVPVITTDADGQELSWLVDQAQARVDATLIYQTEKLGRWVTKVGAWHGRKTIAGVKSATGVDVEPFMRLGDIRPQLDLAIRQNVSLISNVNADTRRRIEAAIFDGFARRRNKRDMTNELAKIMGITKKRARMIAGDQTTKLGVALTQARNEQLGITKYQWMTRRDARVRPEHRARQGKTFRWDKPPYDGHPGYAINCRCVAAAILDDDDG